MKDGNLSPENVQLTASVSQTTDSISRESEIFYNALLATPTFDSNLGIQVIPARDNFALVTGTTASLLQDYASSPSVAGTITVTDAEYSITKKMIFTNFEYDALKNTQWRDAVQDIANEGLPADLEGWIIDFVGKKSKQTFADILWNQNAGLADDPSGTNDGWIKLIKDDLQAASLAAQNIALASDPTDSANIEGLVRGMIAQMPKALVADKEGTRIMMGPVTHQALLSSYVQNAYSNIPTDNANMFDGFRVEMIPNLNDNHILIGKPSNLGLGVAYTSDVFSLKVTDKASLGDGNFARIHGNFGFGAGVATTDWVVGSYPTT